MKSITAQCKLTYYLQYCIFGQRYDECLVWRQNLGEAELSQVMGGVSIQDDEGDAKKSKKDKGIGPKKKVTSAVECKVIIARIQRQKKKYVTSVAGLDTVPDLNIKDAAKVFGKKFASGASIGDLPTGGKEIVIQGDVWLELPELLIKTFKVPREVIFIIEDAKGGMKPYA